MDISNSKKIILGYDVLTYNGEIPNCLPPKFLPTIHSASDFDYSNSGEGYQKRWNRHWFLYNSNFWNENAIKKSVFQIVKYKPDMKWFYLIEPFASLENFFGNDEFYNEFALNNISKVALDSIKNNNGNILINYIIDGGLGINIPNFQKIIDFTRGNGIPDEKVHLVFQDFKLKDNLKKVGVGYNVYDFNMALQSKSQEFNKTLNDPNWSFWGPNSHESQVGKMQRNVSSVATYSEFEESIGKDKKDFLFLCRHWKLHRLILMNTLFKLNLDNHLVSWDNRFYHSHIVDNFEEYEKSPEFVELIRTTSRSLDIEDLTRIAGYGFENKDMYLNSYISLVSESIFFQENSNENGISDFPTGYLSEKVWKPIGHSHPFILAAPSKSLEYLRNMGFKTFHPFIDESYDLVNNDSERLELIIREVRKFSNKTKEEKDQFLKDVAHICKHNHELFLNYTSNDLHMQDFKKILNKLLGDKPLV
jgi:hypothetical protein